MKIILGGAERLQRCGLRVAGCASRVAGYPSVGCRTRVPFWDVSIILDNHQLIMMIIIITNIINKIIIIIKIIMIMVLFIVIPS